MNSLFCTYKTTHPTGFCYYGKAVTEAVTRGLYKGSGKRFTWALEFYPYEEWTSEVLATFPTEAEAYAEEKLVVTPALLKNPWVLNMVVGGKYGRAPRARSARKWYNDGVQSMLHKPGTQPKGWKPGRHKGAVTPKNEELAFLNRSASHHKRHAAEHVEKAQQTKARNRVAAGKTTKVIIKGTK